ncbi:MAG TPA: ABC transporter substrate-binding protein [Anaerolineae bacterium]|nr:ABC transporter substrate-binding protein [Anaerolineae bacterium]
MSRSAHSRHAGLVALAACTILLAAACGPSPSPALPTPAGPAATVTVPIEMPVVISVAGFFDDPILAVLYDQITAFEAANPGVRVELLTVNRDPNRRQEQFAESLAAGDTSIDIYVVSPHWLAGYAAPGWLRPLEGYLAAAGVDPGAFLPAAAEASTVDGRLMALPWSADGGVLYYRRDLLEARGYAPPAAWAELEAMALELRGDGGPAHGFVWQGDEYDGLTCNTLEQVWAAGGDVLDAAGRAIVDSPAAQAALEQMAGYVSGGVSPAEVVSYREAAALADFRSGSAVFMRNWLYAWDRLQEPGSPVAGQVGIAPLPASCLAGQSLVLSAGSLFPEQAFRFMAFLAAPEQQAQLAASGLQAPALIETYQDPALLARNPLLAELYPALLAARPRPQVPDYARLSQAIYTEVHRLLQGSQDPAATAQAIQARLEELLAE